MAEPPLLGRDRELQLLTDVLDRARSGRMQAVFIEGEGGIGKTALLRQTLGRATASGFATLVGSCDELERTRPFAPLIEAFRADQDLTKALGVEGSERGEGMFVGIDAIVDRCERLALERLLVLGLDDIHWADAATLQTLRSLWRRLGYVPIVLLCALRREMIAPELERLIERCRQEGATILPLAPLDEDAVAALTASVLGALPSASLQKEVAGAGGNPLFLLELLKALEQEGVWEVTDARVAGAQRSLPPSLRLTIVRRLSFLPDEAQRIVGTAAILGSIFDPAELAALLGVPATQLLPNLKNCIEAGVLTETGDLLRFTHDLVREALYLDIPQGMRAAMHGEAARALQRVGASPLRIAEHHALGATPGDTVAIAALRHAAAVTRATPVSAAELLTRAVELTLEDDPQRDGLIADLAEALVWTGRTEQARDLSRQVLQRISEGGVAEKARETLIRSLWLDGKWVELREEADRRMASDAPARERGLWLAASALGRTIASNEDLGAIEADARAAIAIGESEGDDRVTLLGFVALMPTLGFQGDATERLALGRQALDRVMRLKDKELQRELTYVGSSVGLAMADLAPAEAEDAFRQAATLREELGVVWDLPMAHALQARYYLGAGRWDEAVAEAEACMAAAEEVGIRHGVVMALSTLGLIAVRRGDLGQARNLIERAEAIEQEAGRQWGFIGAVRTALKEATGDFPGAFADFIDLWNAMEGRPAARWLLAPNVVRLGIQLGERELAKNVTEAMESTATQVEDPYFPLFAWMCRGLIDDDPEPLVAAVEGMGHFRDLLGLACEAAGAALARRGRLEEARRMFAEGIAVSQELGAEADLKRLLSTMRSVGLRTRLAPARKRPVSGWDALTDAERRVALLAAEGLTNPQIGGRLFISRRTVQTHLSHVFDKLQISSRVQLVGAVAEHGGSGTIPPAPALTDD